MQKIYKLKINLVFEPSLRLKTERNFQGTRGHSFKNLNLSYPIENNN